MEGRTEGEREGLVFPVGRMVLAPDPFISTGRVLLLQTFFVAAGADSYEIRNECQYKIVYAFF